MVEQGLARGIAVPTKVSVLQAPGLQAPAAVGSLTSAMQPSVFGECTCAFSGTFEFCDSFVQSSHELLFDSIALKARGGEQCCHGRLAGSGSEPLDRLLDEHSWG